MEQTRTSFEEIQDAVRTCYGGMLEDLAEAYHSAFALWEESSSSDRSTHLGNINKMLHLLKLTIGTISEKDCIAHAEE